MIFTLINSVNKACRGRIYTHDYIGLIKKKGGEKRRGSRWRRRRGGPGTGSLLETHIDTDGGEQGFIWDYLTAYTHTHTGRLAAVYTHTHTYTDAGINKNTFSPRGRGEKNGSAYRRSVLKERV